MLGNFFIKLSILTLIAAGTIWLFISQGFFAGYQSFVWMSLGFLTIITAIVYLMMERALAMKGHTYFMAAFGAAFAIKSLLSLAFISYFIFFQPIVDKNFVIPFFVMYFLYTGVLVSHIWTVTRRKPLP